MARPPGRSEVDVHGFGWLVSALLLGATAWAGSEGQQPPAQDPGQASQPEAPDGGAVASSQQASPSSGGAAEVEDPQGALAPQDVIAKVPTQGAPLKVRRGFFTETNLGTFFTVGGNDAYSNAQSYVQLGLGYDVLDVLELGASVGFGSNAFNCFAGRFGRDGACAQSDAFTVTFFDASIAYLHKLGDRLYLIPRVVGGYTTLDPAPLAGVWRGPNVGLGIGVEYATSMDHFAIGADVVGRYVINARIPTFAIFPRVKYTF